jgi:amino acid adenylation domain-containing protein
MSHAYLTAQSINAPQHLCIHSLLEEHAERIPDALAILAPGRTPLTYGRLRLHIDDVVQALHAIGIGHDDRVALVLPNGPEMAVAFLAVAASATCAPLNPAYSANEFDFYLTALHAKALIVQAGMDSPARAVAKTHGLCVIELSPVLEAEAGLFTFIGETYGHDTHHRFAQPHDVALVLRTSGTTSRPKIVPLTHANICTSAYHTRLALELVEGDKCLNVLPLFYGHGLIATMLASLVAGASIVCTPGFYTSQFFAWLAEFRPTWYSAVPTIHQAILACAPLHREIIACCPLRFIRSASASLPPQIFVELERVFNAPVIEFYGMTEASSSPITCNPLAPRTRKGGSVGVAVGLEVTIIDESGALLPVGITGEIAIRGASVTHGYENNPTANRDAFIHGWFRTGDQGFFDTDGYLFITGRFKELINRGGEKIAPREVDEVLMDHPAVAQAVAFAVPHARLGEEVAAAVVLHEKASAMVNDIRQFAATRLAAFKVPRQILIVNELPKGPTGKLQRIGLAEKLGLTASDQAWEPMQVGFTAPRTPVEEMLVALWAQVFNVKSVSIYADFFQLGGDSLLATQLLTRVREVMHIDVSFANFFEMPTVAEMAKRIGTVSQASSALYDLPLQPVPRNGALPLSYAQQRLWFLEQLGLSHCVYNLLEVTRLVGTLNVAALMQSFQEIIRRHEILRTTFTHIDGQPRQVIGPATHFSLPIVELREVPDEHERETQIHTLVREESQRPFDLAEGPLLRAKLLRLGAEEHVLLLTMHNIVSDGWSHGIFWRELLILYEAYAAGKPSPLPDLSIQYADFAQWQLQCLRGEVLDTQLAYWKQHLIGVSMLQIPTDRPRPVVQTFHGARHPLALSISLTQRLKVLSQQHGVTLFMTLLAAFQTLLHRYTGQDDILVGSLVANRHQIEIERLIGFFVNTVVLRTNLSGDPSFRELLDRVREVTLEAYSHQDVPFEKLLEELRPQRTLSHNPLFQVLFVLHNSPNQTPQLPGLTVSVSEVDPETARFDLTLDLWETSEGLRGWFEYSTDLFDAATIARIEGHLQTLLKGIVADPEQCLSTLPLLTADERHQLLVTWNTTSMDSPHDQCLYEVFEAQVTQTPDAVALVHENEHLTYRELDRRANQVANYLQSLGVGPEVLVGLCMERSLEMIAGLLGILKAGGAYVPLDPAYPPERLTFMLQDAQISVLLTQESLMAGLPDCEAEVVCLDATWHTIAQQSDQKPDSKTTTDNLAYVLYTSGSTGRPKGVLGTHRMVLNVLTWLWQAYPFAPQEVACQKTSISFVDSIQELLGPLLGGTQTVLIPDEVQQDPHRFVQTLAAYQVTRILLVPSLLRVLLDTYTDLQHRLPHLKLWFASGEILPRELWQRFQSYMPHGHLINLYGASENAADVTWYDTEQMCKHLVNVPIGRPIANTQTYVLDRNLQPVPVGVTGELHVGGVGLARGYLNCPELTAEKFIPHPFSNEPGARLYKTGDLARYLPDGNLEYLGRLDYQVKIRGVRIELGEIETGLEQHLAVRQVVVLAQEAASGDTRLVAYIVPTQEPAPTTSELHRFLTAKLPVYMVPAAFVFLDTLPLTPSGKVDRNALPQPEGSRPQLDREFVAPHDAVERQLTHIWEDLLGVKPIGVQDDFFELGGHSLLAVQLFARIEKVTGKRLPLATLFQTPTIAHLAHSLRQDGVVAPQILPGEIYNERIASDRIRHPIASYLPPKFHPYAKSTYDRLKQSSLARAVRRIYIRQGKNMATTFFSYTPLELVNTLKTMGITAGDTVLMHSAFRVLNGFDGTPDLVIECVLNLIGESGNLSMVSMPYTRSTAAYLQAGVPFDVQHTMSAMGIITEMFRHQPGVVRSINPAHPILACGPAAPWLIADHEHTLYSCGKGSPFEKLVHMQAKALFFDVSLRSMTFFHYLEDLFQETLPVKLYEETPVESTVIDTSGTTRIVKTYVFSSDSRRYRNMRNLQKEFVKSRVIQSKKIGNTRLTVLHLRQVVECAQHMVSSGTPLWTM